MFSAPDSWTGPHGLTMGAPEHIGRLLRSVAAIFSRPRLLRRLSPRYRCRLDASLLPASGDAMPVSVIDISSRGAALRMSRGAQLPTPERFRLSVRWNDIERTTLEARIRSARNGAGNERILGVVFLELDAEQRADLFKHLYDDRPARPVPRTAS